MIKTVSINRQPSLNQTRPDTIMKDASANAAAPIAQPVDLTNNRTLDESKR